jgi:hypothetical protein
MPTQQLSFGRVGGSVNQIFYPKSQKDPYDIGFFDKIYLSDLKDAGGIFFLRSSKTWYLSFKKFEQN